MSEDDKPTFPVWYGYPTIPKGRRSLVGRDELLAEVKQRLLAGEDVAIYGGLPGCGKTEMAAQLVEDEQIKEHFKDGILWVGLGNKLREGDITYRLSEWAANVGIPRERLGSLMDAEQIAKEITDAIRDRSILLVIDDAWDSETAWTFRRGRVSCAHLLTTRLFNVAYDFADPTEPIPVPELDNDAARELLAQYIPRVVEQRPKEIEECLKVAAGLPLSLNLIGLFLRKAAAGGRHELDAALKKVTNAEELLLQKWPHQVEERYKEGREFKEGDVPLTLRAIIMISEEPLEPATRAALRALTVFPPKVNTFSLRAGAAVAGPNTESEGEHLLKELREQGLTELTEQGLTELTDRETEERYTMHMAIWEYARQGLTDKSAYQRMAEYFIKHIKEKEASGESKTRLLASLELEHDNLRHALDQLIHDGEAYLGLRLAGALWKFWYERSYFDEGRQYIQKLCALPRSQIADLATGSAIPETVRELAWARAKVLNDAGNFAYNQGELFETQAKALNDGGNVADTQDAPPPAEKLYNESLRLREQIGDEQGQAGTWNNLGLLDRARGDFTSAERYFRDALKVNRNKGNKSWEAINLNNLGVVAAWKGDGRTAQEFQETSLALFRSLNDDWGIAMAQSDLGAALLLQGDHTGATARYKESLKRRWQIKDNRGIASALRGLAGVAMVDAQLDRAMIQYKAALGVSMNLRDRGGMIEALEGLAAVARARGEAGRAVRLYAAADAFRHSIRFAIPPAAAAARERELNKARADLDDEHYQQIWEAAADLALDDIDEVAREALEGPSPSIEHVLELSLHEEAKT